MTRGPTPFNYGPLSSHDCIRILSLEPGSGNDIIQCTIKERPLTEAEGQYEGISYVWGTDGPTAKILCDGNELYITANLDDALRRFRLKEELRFVWVDAVCINQQDSKEKSDQVRRMGEIFRRAKGVLCWLGRDDDGMAESCFTLIRESRKALGHEWREDGGMRNLIQDLKLSFPPTAMEEWEKVTRLLEMPWFQRLWVVQESGLARECYLFWGDHHIQFYEVLGVATFRAYNAQAPVSGQGRRAGKILFDVFCDIMCTFDNEPTWRDKTLTGKTMQKLLMEKPLFVNLLFCARSLQTTDQRDIIYSTFGSPLAYDESGEAIVPPDYNESFDCLQIRAAKSLLQNPREAPYVLTFVTHESEEELRSVGIPSWAPRWKTFSRSTARPIPLIYSYEHRQKPYRANCGNASFKPRFLSGKTLSVTGWTFDTIAWTSPRLRSAELQSDITRWDAQFVQNKISLIETIWLELFEQSQESLETLLDSLSLTLARGRPRSKHHAQDFLAYCKTLREKIGTNTASPFPTYDTSKGNASNAEWVMSRARDRCFALTARGRMALVPLVATPGDICSIIQGMDIPMVLRRTQSGMYQCVGESYCSGVMEGELFAPEASQAPQWETYLLQ